MSTYIASVAPIVDTNAHYIAYGQSFGGAFTTFGWVAQTGHGEVPASGTGASYAWTSTTAPTTALTAQVNYNFRGAFVPSTTYTGSNTANAANVDVVTSSGVTYAHITATSNAATAPGSDTTNWQPLIFEIWKTNGSNTTGSNPIPVYIKIIYTVSSTGGTSPRLLISIGTGVDANGNLTGSVVISTSNPNTVLASDNSTNSSSVLFNNVFSGDADNFRCILQSGNTVSVNYIGTIVIARSQSASGTDTNAFVFVGTVLPLAGLKTSRSSVLPNTQFSNGSPINATSTGWAGATTAAGCSNNMNAFGGTPAFPVYPVIGMLANPLIGAIGFHVDDVTDATVVPIWIFGASHNYYVNVRDTTAAQSIDNVAAHGINAAILFE